MSGKALALVPEAAASLSLAEIKEMATQAAESGLFPAIKTPAAAFTLMLLCQAEGLHPIQALRRYHIIEGQPSMRADAILAEFQRRGGVVDWHQHDQNACSATFTAPGQQKPATVTWTMDDAKRAELAGRGTWKKYPRQMLRARVISEGVRMAMPEVVVGIYTEEEVRDFVPDPKAAPAPVAVVDAQVVEATPTPAPVEAPVAPEPPKATPAQIKALHAGAPKGTREEKLAWISGIIGRTVESSRDLTVDEVSKCIDAARAG